MDLKLRKCKDMDPAFFFPKNTKPGPNSVTQEELEEEAARFCVGCRIQTECINYAISIGEWNGVWGATPTRRREIYRSTVRKIAV